MSDKRIPMVAEVLQVEPQQQAQSSYGTGTPKKIKKPHTALIVFLSLLCIFLATVLGILGAKHLHIDLTGGKLRFRPEPEQQADAPDERELLPNEDATQPTENNISVSGRAQIGWQLPQKEALSVQEIYAAVSPGVVCVLTDGTACGTGIVIGEDGLLLTSADVLNGSGDTAVLCADGTEGTAKLIGYDRTTGFALLSSDLDLKPLCFGDTGTLQVGDPVYCIGSPYGRQMRNTLSEGRLTGIGVSDDLGQHLTLLSSGAAFSDCYGCPLLDGAGNVIGVTSQVGTLLTDKDPCFAVSAEDVQRIAKEILADAEAHKNCWLGFEAEDIPQTYLYYYGFPGAVWITEVGENTYAYGALNEYDVILSVGGIPVGSAAAYEEILASCEIGDILELRIYRGGIFYKIDLPLTAK